MIRAQGTLSLPPQMLALKDKTEAWRKDCMDSMEAIGRSQVYANGRLIENYEMIRGKFIYSHYIEREDYVDLVNQLTEELQIPSYLRHYDIIAQVINTLSGEYQKRPDIFRVRAMDENAKNNFNRQKSELVLQYAMNDINTFIETKLINEGLDPYKKDFTSQEEMQAYQQQLAQRRNSLTPPEVERYMQTSWMDSAEIWAEHQLEHDRQIYSLHEKEKTEFEDMLTAARCFRHFYLTPNGYGFNQETWNPINTFFHKSPEVEYIENGDYVGRIFFLTIPEIINRYGHRMKKSDLDSLEKLKRDSYDAKNIVNGEATWAGLTPGTLVPYQDYDQLKFTKDTLGFDPNNPESIHDIDTALGLNEPGGDRTGIFQVTEAYWMSQRKIGKYVYLDEETGQVATMLVDENFKLPGVRNIDNAFMESTMTEQVNTVTWTWVNEVWTGIKINNKYTNLAEPIYLDMEPAEFQFKGDANIYGAKLPVCGQVFGNRNAEPMSLVDLMKPHQIGYNVAMNQLYEIMNREVGRFMLMDSSFIPSTKDWGGPRNFERLMLIAKQLGIAPLDGSPANTGNSSFAHFQVMDLDESSRMMSRLRIAEAFETFALKQVGITPQRQGSVAASESATGVQQAVNQSYAQTESYFTNFSNYKRRCMQMNLEIAQFVQAKKETVALNYVKSDMSRAFIQVAGTDLLLSEFSVRVANSAEEARKLEMIRQFALENNTSGASPADIATIIMSNSPAEIKAQLNASYEKSQQMQQQQLDAQQQIEQQKLQAAAEEAERKRQFEAEQNELDRANNRYIAEVKGISVASVNGSPDADANGIPDVMEVQKYNLELNKHTEDILFKNQQEASKRQEAANKAALEREKLALQKEQMDKETQENEKDRAIEREKMASQEKIARQNKNKYDKK